MARICGWSGTTGSWNDKVDGAAVMLLVGSNFLRSCAELLVPLSVHYDLWRRLSLKVISFENYCLHTHARPSAVPGPLIWSVKCERCNVICAITWDCWNFAFQMSVVKVLLWRLALDRTTVTYFSYYVYARCFFPSWMMRGKLCEMFVIVTSLS